MSHAVCQLTISDLSWRRRALRPADLRPFKRRKAHSPPWLRKCTVSQLQLDRTSATVPAVVREDGNPAAFSPALCSQETTSVTVPAMWQSLATAHGDQLAVVDPHHSPAQKLTYRELGDQMMRFASGLSSLGLRPGERVALFSENSSRWLVADQGIMMAGAADAVRGTSSPPEELAFIMRHSRASGLVVQDTHLLERLLPSLVPVVAGSGGGSSAADHVEQASAVTFVIVLWGEPSQRCRSSLSVPVLAFADVLSFGAPATNEQLPLVRPNDLATLVYTSGTTGQPKGVMLTHANLAYQMVHLNYYLGVSPGDRTLSLLPPWHIYERSAGYYIFSRAACQVYTNIRRFRDDLTTYPPDHFVCVPLVLETLYGKVMAKLKKESTVKRMLALTFLAISAAFVHARRVAQGTALAYARTARPMWAYVAALATCAVLAPLHKLAGVLVYAKIRTALGIRRVVVSGGGSLAAHLDDFYEVLDLPVLNGWGLTETSPVLACRRSEPLQNIRGTVGLPIPGTQVRVVNPESLVPVPDGQQGLLLARGPGVMAGYLEDPAATARAFSAGDGWFDTGDLGWRAPGGVPGSCMAGHIVLTGRAKDTIVLSSGENVEPQPIEDAAVCSPYIKNIIVLGQDRRALGALVAPDLDAFAELEAIKGPLSANDRLDVIRSELAKVVASRPRQEAIHSVVLVKEPFSVEDGTLTRTMKPRRAAVLAKYASEVRELERCLR